MAHISVLQKEVKEILDLQSGDVLLDATVNGGGHSADAAPILGVHGAIIGIDRDSDAINRSKAKLSEAICSVTLVQDDFRNLDRLLSSYGMRTPTKILFDLGWNASQFFGSDSDALATAGRGFSFQKDEPLLMTFKQNVEESDTTAYDVVNNWDEENLADVIYGYGEERYSRRIAKAIVASRSEGPIKSSGQLAEIIKNAVPIFYRFGRIHPATKTFQAIRIAVNDELQALEEGLSKGFNILDKEGRMAVISFHSLEDRIVKRFFKLQVTLEKGILINKKPITPDDEEITKNPRSRSAKLRIIQKI